MFSKGPVQGSNLISPTLFKDLETLQTFIDEEWINKIMEYLSGISLSTKEDPDTEIFEESQK